MNSGQDIVVVGGGVIGLSIAYRLAKRQVKVTVIDAGHGGQASYAAAGMLTPLAESRIPGPCLTLGLLSLEIYPDFISEIADDAAVDLEIKGAGTLRVARTDIEHAELRGSFGWQESLPIKIEMLTGDEARQLEPELSPDIRAATLTLQERQIHPRQLLLGLKEACLELGVTLLTETAVQGLLLSGDRIEGVITESDTFSCDSVVLAGGAWTSEMSEWLPGTSFPISPTKGHIFSVRPAAPFSLRHNIFTYGTYIVPRGGGQLVVGATEEPDAGFDTEIDPAAINMLRSNAAQLAPNLLGQPVQSAWTGFRPTSIDNMPLIGRAPGYENAYIASGHGRKGILQTPLTAKLIAGLILDNIPPPPELNPGRFTRN